MLRRLGNALTVLGSLSGLFAAYLWWKTAATNDQIAFAYFSRNAALATGVCAMLIAVAEAIRLVRRHRAERAETPYYPVRLHPTQLSLMRLVVTATQLRREH